MNMNIETITQTYKSYVDAMQRFSDRGFNTLSRTGSGYTHYLGEEFEANQTNLHEADGVSIEVAPLMEYGAPKVIDKSYFIYRDTFIQFEFYSEEKYTTYSLEHDFATNEYIAREAKHTLIVKHSGFSVGLGYWSEERKAELRKKAVQCKPVVAAKILEAIEHADSKVAEWQIARQNLINNDLVGAETKKTTTAL